VIARAVWPVIMIVSLSRCGMIMIIDPRGLWVESESPFRVCRERWKERKKEKKKNKREASTWGDK